MNTDNIIYFKYIKNKKLEVIFLKVISFRLRNKRNEKIENYHCSHNNKRFKIG